MYRFCTYDNEDVSVERRKLLVGYTASWKSVRACSMSQFRLYLAIVKGTWLIILDSVSTHLNGTACNFMNFIVLNMLNLRILSKR